MGMGDAFYGYRPWFAAGIGMLAAGFGLLGFLKKPVKSEDISSMRGLPRYMDKETATAERAKVAPGAQAAPAAEKPEENISREKPRISAETDDIMHDARPAPDGAVSGGEPHGDEPEKKRSDTRTADNEDEGKAQKDITEKGSPRAGYKHARIGFDASARLDRLRAWAAIGEIQDPRD